MRVWWKLRGAPTVPLMTQAKSVWPSRAALEPCSWSTLIQQRWPSVTCPAMSPQLTSCWVQCVRLWKGLARGLGPVTALTALRGALEHSSDARLGVTLLLIDDMFQVDDRRTESATPLLTFGSINCPGQPPW